MKETKMFCFQCQETAKGTGCTTRGVCGKLPETSLFFKKLSGVHLGDKDTYKIRNYRKMRRKSLFVSANYSNLAAFKLDSSDVRTRL